MPTDPVTSLTDLHIRASMASPFNSARALSKPNRVLAPPAITYPVIVTLPIVRIPRQTLFADSKESLPWNSNNGQRHDNRIRYGRRRKHAIWFRQSARGIERRGHARADVQVG